MTSIKYTPIHTLKKFFEKSFYLSLFSAIAFTSSSYADDTEVFIAEGGLEGGRPNVLLMFDSSASMSQSISYIEGYEQTLSVSEADGCRNDTIYVKTGTNNQLPSCGNNAVSPAAFACKDISSILVEVGTINARVQQLTGQNLLGLEGNWANFQSGFPNSPIDCLADQGVHGAGELLTIDAGQVALIEDPTSDVSRAYVRNTYTDLPDRARGQWRETEDTSIVFGDDTFVTFYTGHYLNYANSGVATEIKGSGIDLATLALTNVINSFDQINLGIARYNKGGNSDAQILAPIVSLADENNRQDLIKYYIGSLKGTLNGQQPMAAGQYEAYRYFKGEGRTLGSTPDPAALQGAGTGNPSADDNDGRNTIGLPYNPITNLYNSPITEAGGACQGNYVLYLTASGSSGTSNTTETRSNNATGKKQSADGTVATLATTLSSQFGTCGTVNDDCLDELTAFMYTNDLVDLPIKGFIDGKEVIQNVVTYGISINAAAPDLDDAAIDGGGRFTKAESPAAIEAALSDILSEIVGNNVTFVAPSISVNNFNRLQNLNDLYYSLFTPTEYRVWNGNLKKYKLIDGQIKDALGNLAVDPDTGAFNKKALSYWTDQSDPDLAANKDSKNTDGDVAELGGFVSRRKWSTGNRTAYTNHADSDNLLVNLDGLNPDNSFITESLLKLDDATLGLSPAEQAVIRKGVLNWGQGIVTDAAGNTDINKFIGDLLHTTPVVLTYENGQTDPDKLDQTIYFGTNNGFIHAAKANPLAGAEIEEFLYAPYETLTNLYTYFTNETSKVKLYGIDGPMSSWVEETNNDLVIDANLGEKAYLYATQRRGGRNIYALEVSDRSTPKLAWKVRGGVDPKFSELGQTWSAVQHATIKNAIDPTTPLEVAFFAGGYDENQDTGSDYDAPASAAAATKGRAIYMVNAKTGELLWRAAYNSSYAESETELDLPNMTYAIPSDLRVLDVNSDGYADRIYVGDLGGQIWRFDMTTPKNNIDKFRITGGVIANLSKNNVSDTSTLDVTTGALNNKRFYNAPSVSLVSNNAYGTYLALSIGSGYRAHPLDETLNEKFYMLKDSYVFGPELDATTSDPVYDLEKIIYDNSTDLLDISTIVSPTFAQVSSRRGWSIDFSENGEKVINPAITADNKIFFTTYIPESTSDGEFSCAPNANLGKSRLYGVSLFTGGVINTVTEYDDAGNEIPTTLEDRFTELATPGISPPPELFIESITGGGTNTSTVADCASTTAVTLLVGTETVNPNVCTEPVRTYWQRVEE